MIIKKQLSKEQVSFFKELTQLPDLRKVEQFVDNEIDSVYETFLIYTDKEQWVLKKAEANELEVNQKLAKSNLYLPIPQLIDTFYFKKNNWLLLEYIGGTDLQKLTKQGASRAGIALATITNSFYDENANLKKLDNKIVHKLEVNSLLHKAYQLYLTRQATIPITFIHDDCLPTNILFDGQNIAIVDWAYGKIGSYVSDIGRLYAFYCNSEQSFNKGFSFLDSDNSKENILLNYYEALSPKLTTKISKEQFKRDVSLECLNQYLLNLGAPIKITEKFLESDWEKHFFQKALLQAKDILE